MKPTVLLLLLGAVFLVNATFRPTDSSNHGWLGYKHEDPNKFAYQMLGEWKEGKPRASRAAGTIELEKRRNLLVGRYGFRIGKRSLDEQGPEVTQKEYDDAVQDFEGYIQ
ncbi:hypothetical protein B9Z55_023073 [Caenorhabditis nigoni]|uniref:Uncharacterized protein n=1 Tax=Caenorhabditis nigoni TaxID=1611254 RepID=A0A2G5SN85_9PELO|nr:hypothetical protein B9Z55_023073 [Caenorhabditis nigoni]